MNSSAAAASADRPAPARRRARLGSIWLGLLFRTLPRRAPTSSLSRDLRRPATSLSVKLPRGETVRGKRVLTPKTPELKPIRPNEGRYRFLIFAQEAVVRRAQHVVNIDAVIGKRKQTTPK